MGKRFAQVILASTSSCLIGVMCLFFVLLSLSCNPEKNQPVKTEEKAFVKIDFAWAGGSTFFGGLLIDSSGYCVSYHKSLDSSFIDSAQLNDSIKLQINELINQVQADFSCLDNLNNDSSTVKCSDAPLAEIRIYKSGKVKTIRCFVTPGEEPRGSDSTIIKSKSILNTFFNLYFELNPKQASDCVFPFSEALEDIRLLRPPPPMRQSIKFDEK
ncbi:MAG: hypothetical protein ACK5Z2_15630 [Bacteroidota bacterium]